MKPRVWLLLSLAVSAVTWLYAVKVLLPATAIVGAEYGTLTQLGDLYPRWVGTRELLLYGRNPYGPEVSHEIQQGFYGHSIEQRSDVPGIKLIDEQRFAYPIYVVFLMAPTVHLEFSQVRRWAPLVLLLLAAPIVPFSLDLLRWRLPWESVAALTLFTVSSPQIVHGIEHQQMAVLVGLLLVAAASCASRGRHHLAGVLLACSTIKPQLALFPICFFLIWTSGNLRQRWRLLAAFLISLAALTAAGEWLLPGWLADFVAGIAAYRRYFPTTSILRVVFGETLGIILGAIIVLLLLVLAWRERKQPIDSRQQILVFASFLIGTLLAFPLLTPFNQVLLIFPAILLVSEWRLLPRLSQIVFAAAVTWPWIAFCELLVFPPRLDSLKRVPLLPSALVLFFPLLLPVLLMSRRTASLPQLQLDNSQRS